MSRRCEAASPYRVERCPARCVTQRARCPRSLFEEGTSSTSSSLTHARRPRVRPCGPCHTLRVLLTQCRLTALRPSGTSPRSCPNCLQAFSSFVQNSYRPSLFFKIQNLKFKITTLLPFTFLRVHSRFNLFLSNLEFKI